MKIAVRYQSRGGNTKTVAQAIAKTLGVNAEPIDVPLDGATDILFVGGGVYFGTINGKLKKFLNSLSTEFVKSAVAFTTCDEKGGTDKIISILNKRGIEVKPDCLEFKTTGNYNLFGSKRELKLAQENLDEIINFAKKASGIGC